MNKKIQHRSFDAKRVRQNFAEVPGFYDYWAKATESKATKRVLELAGIEEHESVLEVGVGTGLLFEQILIQNKQGFTAGIDLSPDMLVKAKKRLNHLKDERNFSLQQASAYELPFEDQRFDCLISCYMLDLLPEEDFTAILKEFKRVLKPGGRLVMASMAFGSKWYHHFWEWMTETFPDLMTDCRPVNLGPFVEEAGFRIEKTEEISQNTFPSQVIKAMKP